MASLVGTAQVNVSRIDAGSSCAGEGPAAAFYVMASVFDWREREGLGRMRR